MKQAKKSRKHDPPLLWVLARPAMWVYDMERAAIGQIIQIDQHAAIVRISDDEEAHVAGKEVACRWQDIHLVNVKPDPTFLPKQ